MIRVAALILIALLLVLWLSGEAEAPEVTRVIASEQKFPTSWPSTTSTSQPSHVQVITSVPRARTHPTAPSERNVWDAIAQCESGGRWNDTRGGYEGGVHFLHSTWVAAGGRKYAEHAYQATREQQIEIAQAWLARTSWAQWPVCSRKVGAR